MYDCMNSTFLTPSTWKWKQSDTPRVKFWKPSFDDDFRLSDGYSSDNGEDLYAYLGKPSVLRSDIKALMLDVITVDDDGDLSDDDDDSTAEFGSSGHSSGAEDPLGVTGTRRDSGDSSKSDMHEQSENDDSDNSFPGKAQAISHNSSSMSEMSSGESEEIYLNPAVKVVLKVRFQVMVLGKAVLLESVVLEEAVRVDCVVLDEAVLLESVVLEEAV